MDRIQLLQGHSRARSVSPTAYHQKIALLRQSMAGTTPKQNAPQQHGERKPLAPQDVNRASSCFAASSSSHMLKFMTKPDSSFQNPQQQTFSFLTTRETNATDCSPVVAAKPTKVTYTSTNQGSLTHAPVSTPSLMLADTFVPSPQEMPKGVQLKHGAAASADTPRLTAGERTDMIRRYHTRLDAPCSSASSCLSTAVAVKDEETAAHMEGERTCPHPTPATAAAIAVSSSSCASSLFLSLLQLEPESRSGDHVTAAATCDPPSLLIDTAGLTGDAHRTQAPLLSQPVARPRDDEERQQAAYEELRRRYDSLLNTIPSRRGEERAHHSSRVQGGHQGLTAAAIPESHVTVEEHRQQQQQSMNSGSSKGLERISSAAAVYASKGIVASYPRPASAARRSSPLQFRQQQPQQQQIVARRSSAQLPISSAADRRRKGSNHHHHNNSHLIAASRQQIAGSGTAQTPRSSSAPGRCVFSPPPPATTTNNCTSTINAPQQRQHPRQTTLRTSSPFLAFPRGTDGIEAAGSASFADPSSFSFLQRQHLPPSSKQPPRRASLHSPALSPAATGAGTGTPIAAAAAAATAGEQVSRTVTSAVRVRPSPSMIHGGAALATTRTTVGGRTPTPRSGLDAKRMASMYLSASSSSRRQQQHPEVMRIVSVSRHTHNDTQVEEASTRTTAAAAAAAAAPHRTIRTAAALMASAAQRRSSSSHHSAHKQEGERMEAAHKDTAAAAATAGAVHGYYHESNKENTRDHEPCLRVPRREWQQQHRQSSSQKQPSSSQQSASSARRALVFDDVYLEGSSHHYDDDIFTASAAEARERRASIHNDESNTNNIRKKSTIISSQERRESLIGLLRPNSDTIDVRDYSPRSHHADESKRIWMSTFATTRSAGPPRPNHCTSHSSSSCRAHLPDSTAPQSSLPAHRGAFAMTMEASHGTSHLALLPSTHPVASQSSSLLPFPSTSNASTTTTTTTQAATVADSTDTSALSEASVFGKLLSADCLARDLRDSVKKQEQRQKHKSSSDDESSAVDRTSEEGTQQQQQLEAQHIRSAEEVLAQYQQKRLGWPKTAAAAAVMATASTKKQSMLSNNDDDGADDDDDDDEPQPRCPDQQQQQGYNAARTPGESVIPCMTEEPVAPPPRTSRTRSRHMSESVATHLFYTPVSALSDSNERRGFSAQRCGDGQRSNSEDSITSGMRTCLSVDDRGFVEADLTRRVCRLSSIAGTGGMTLKGLYGAK